MIVVADSSPLNYLILLEQTALLHRLYGDVLVPEAVAVELRAASAPQPVREWISRPPSWIEIVAVSSEEVASVAVDLDRGERAAIALAERVGADLILIDEVDGRTEAVRRSFRVTLMHLPELTLYAANTAVRRDTLLVLAHGAGAGQAHPFMVRSARGLAERGLDVFTFDFPYMAAKRRSPDRAPVLEAAFRDAVRAAARHPQVRASRLVIGGKSMGGRMASHLAAAPEAWPSDAPPLGGVIVLGYPLKPPGGARGDRVSHLFKIAVPTLIVQGTRDSFGGPDDVRAAIGDRQPLVTIHRVEGGDHSLAVPKSSGRPSHVVDEEIWNTVVGWLQRKP